MAAKPEYDVTTTHISRRPGYCGGEPCIHGRRIKVRHVYVWYELLGMSADQIASDHDLTLAQVHAALSYAYEHLDDIRQAMQAADDVAAIVKAQTPSKLPRSVSPNDDE
jgi:uncharacterized protein (DUF433 family)